MNSARTVVFFGAMLSIILGAGFQGLVGPAGAFESVEQERTWCIKECKDRYGVDVMWRGGGRGGDSMWRLYFKCIDDCEKKFWKEWQKDMDKLEKD
jgi:hypothetical protein